MIHHNRNRWHGAALVEFAIIVPILVTLILFSMYFEELVRARLKIQEVSRYAAFEMTSYALTDYVSAAHQTAFDGAATSTRIDVLERYRDLDSSRLGPPSEPQPRYENLDLRLENMAMPFSDNRPGNVSAGGSGWLGSVLDVANKPVSEALKSYGFNTKGVISAEASVTVHPWFLSSGPFLRSGGGDTFFSLGLPSGSGLDALNLKSRYTLVASGWHLPDGRDSVIGGKRAGVYRGTHTESLLHRQVSRMTFLGAKAHFSQLPGVSTVLGVLKGVAPDPTGTYVVSHNYGLTDPAHASGCDYLENYPPAAKSGLNNLSRTSQVDSARPVCFDTAPFRDRAKYQDSLYVKLFEARGPYFMGCKSAQVDCQ